MKRFTLDTNCLIDIENEAPDADKIRDLYQRNENEDIRLCLPAVGASEHPKNGLEVKTFEDFNKRVAEAGIPNVELLMPYMFLNLTFLNYSMLSDESMMELDRKIHQILFPNLPYLYSDYCLKKGLDPQTLPLDRKWRNAKCDVMIAWCHIHHGGDVLVTRDGNFHKKTKEPQLRSLGAGAIMTPREASQSLGDS